MDKNWASLLGVIIAQNYEEFSKAYSLCHSKKGGACQSKVSKALWQVISGEIPDLNYYNGKRHREKHRLSKEVEE